MNINFKPIVLALAGVLTTTVYADDAVTMDAIEVVSQTPLQSIGVPANEVPANVQVVNAKEITRQKPNTIADLMQNNLGSVNISNGTGNPFQPDVSYRGATASPQLGQPSGLSVYFDGVRFNEPLGDIVNWDLIPMNAISSINLIPGSNPLFGLNTLGGAIAVNTKNGKDFQGGSVSMMGGSWGTLNGKMEYGGVDKKHNLDYFLSGNVYRSDGWRAGTSTNVNQFYGNVRWHSDDNSTHLALSGAYADNAMNQGQSLPLSMAQANPKQAYTGPDWVKNQMAFINLKGDTWVSDTKLLEGNVYFRNSNAQAMNSNAQTDNAPPSWNNPGGWTGPGTLTGWANDQVPSAPCVSGSSGCTRLDGPTIDASNVYSQTRQTGVGTTLQMTALDKLFDHENSFTPGVSFNYSKVNFEQQTYTAALIGNQTVNWPGQYWVDKGTGKTVTVNGQKLLGIGPTAYLNRVGMDGNYNYLPYLQDQTSFNSRNYYTGIFASDTFSVTNDFKLNAALRYDIARIQLGGVDNNFYDLGTADTNAMCDGNNKINGSIVGCGPSSLGFNGTPVGTGLTSLNGSHTYSRLNPSVGFTYNPYRSIGYYAGYREGMRAPNAMELECSDPSKPCTLPVGFTSDPSLKMVVAKTWEVGARGTLYDDWHWNVALYTSDFHNDIQYASTSTTSGYFTNVGTTNRRGIEFGTSKKLFDKLTLTGNYSFVDATYQSSFQMATSSALAPQNATQTGNIETINKGNHLPGIAKNTVKLRAAYEITPEWYIAGNFVFASAQWAHGNESNQDPSGKVPGYAYLNLDTGYKFNDDWKLSLLINNVTNKRYYTYGMLGTNIYTGNNELFVTPSMPISVYATLTYSFGGSKKTSEEVDKD